MSDNNININTPDIGPYTQLKPFRFWCQKVLPLVYDESLSYYELLCKVVDYLNKTMEDVDQMITDMGDFKTADTEFKTEVRDAYIAFSREVSQAVEGLETFVNNYFNNLNVQQEINNKLDAMAQAGYFDTLFATLFTDDIITEAGNVTSAWIAENLLQETGYVIDNSLTVANAAADAKATGDKITVLEEQLEANSDSLSKVEETENISLTMNRYQEISINTKQINTSVGGSFYLSSPVSVNPGELYRITSEGYGDAAAFALGNDGTIIDVYPETYVSVSQIHYVIDRLVKIPTGVNEIYISNTSQGETTQYSLKKVIENHSLKYVQQNLTDEQQYTSRLNINAVSKADFDEIAEYKWADFSITTTGSKLINDHGVVTDYTGHDSYMISNNLSVEGKSFVKVSGSANYANGICVFYDSNNNVVEMALKSNTGTSAITTFTDEVLIVPPNASYMVLAGITTAPTASYNDGYVSKKVFDGLKWAAVGDSLTEVNSRTTMNYHAYIAEETGITVINMGQSGSGYKRKEDSNNAFYQRVLNIPNDADVVTIFGSGNDQIYYGAEDMGTATDTGTTTLGGCINTTIDNIYSILPTVQLGIIAPCPWQGYNPVNHNNGMAKYTELLKEICENRSIPFLDLYHASNLRPWDATFRALAYSRDDGNGTHPDETGHKLLAGRIRVFLNSLIGAY